MDDSGETISCANEKDEKIAMHFRNIQTKLASECVSRRVIENNFANFNGNTAIFSTSDILQAMDSCNFEKAIGPDGFDGKIIKMNNELKQKLAFDIKNRMNSNQIPSHLREGRLVALSKNKNNNAPSLNDIRPIVINSHLTKIMERAILLKLNSMNSSLLKVGRYQTGFKEGKSTGINLMKILQMVSNKDQNPQNPLPYDFRGKLENKLVNLNHKALG